MIGSRARHPLASEAIVNIPLRTATCFFLLAALVSFAIFVRRNDGGEYQGLATLIIGVPSLAVLNAVLGALVASKTGVGTKTFSILLGVPALFGCALFAVDSRGLTEGADRIVFFVFWALLLLAMSLLSVLMTRKSSDPG